ncbi:STM4015 family protein [Actinacidiphila bryophytorum]|uniref:STM4015 family protein n=1 Tax=Actinacidiphila bryophytorum TaxID=1436133 RepID=UPI002176C6F7|nr:STM4015 family protein [Actinacidiphila bryophytorum]UWE07510.1 STM4015 family protein [Actinacidiphila bryophytorum]
MSAVEQPAVAHLDELHGLPVHDFTGSQDPLPAAGTVAWRLSLDAYAEDADDAAGETDGPDAYGKLWQRFLTAVDPAGVRALVVGSWGDAAAEDSREAVRLLVEARGQLTGLLAVFVGDLAPEEAALSWIGQCDMTPLLTAYPQLQELGIRGGADLVLAPVRHGHLRTLAIESAGLPAGVVRALGASDLPALEYLELWLGVPECGGNTAVADLAPLLAGERLPALRHLGLRNSADQDAIAGALAEAPIVARLTSLDLSLGTLGDEGAAALLAGQPLTHLSWLDLHHHFLGDKAAQAVRDALEPAGVEVDLDDAMEAGAGEPRYVAVEE